MAGPLQAELKEVLQEESLGLQEPSRSWDVRRPQQEESPREAVLALPWAVFPPAPRLPVGPPLWLRS